MGIYVKILSKTLHDARILTTPLNLAC